MLRYFRASRDRLVLRSSPADADIRTNADVDRYGSTLGLRTWHRAERRQPARASATRFSARIAVRAPRHFAPTLARGRTWGRWRPAMGLRVLASTHLRPRLRALF